MDAVNIPTGSNILSKTLGRKLILVREERGLDADTAAKQCGLVPSRWFLFEAGALIPDRNEAERIYRWAFEGINYWSYPLKNEKKKISRGDGWKTHKYNVNKEMDIRIARAASRLGLSISALTQLAMEQFLTGEGALSTYEEAARRLEKAIIVERVSEDPYMASFLSGDIDIAVNMGAKLTDPPKKKETKPPVEILLEKFHADMDEEENEVL